MKPSPQYDSEKPYFFNVPVDPSWSSEVQQTNVCYTRKMVTVADIRGHEADFALDRHGFQLGQFRTQLAYDDFRSTEKIVSCFYDEVRSFLQSQTGATHVLPFDFQVGLDIHTLPGCGFDMCLGPPEGPIPPRRFKGFSWKCPALCCGSRRYFCLRSGPSMALH